jgi:hypothetical protein
MNVWGPDHLGKEIWEKVLGCLAALKKVWFTGYLPGQGRPDGIADETLDEALGFSCSTIASGRLVRLVNGALEDLVLGFFIFNHVWMSGWSLNPSRRSLKKFAFLLVRRKGTTASIFYCKVGILPVIYLGLPLCCPGSYALPILICLVLSLFGFPIIAFAAGEEENENWEVQLFYIRGKEKSGNTQNHDDSGKFQSFLGFKSRIRPIFPWFAALLV